MRPHDLSGAGPSLHPLQLLFQLRLQKKTEAADEKRAKRDRDDGLRYDQDQRLKTEAWDRETERITAASHRRKQREAVDRKEQREYDLVQDQKLQDERTAKLEDERIASQERMPIQKMHQADEDSRRPVDVGRERLALERLQALRQ